MVPPHSWDWSSRINVMSPSDPGNLVPFVADASLPAIEMNGSRFHACIREPANPVTCSEAGWRLPVALRPSRPFQWICLADDCFLYWDQRGSASEGSMTS
jgi:hypothetical protein